MKWTLDSSWQVVSSRNENGTTESQKSRSYTIQGSNNSRLTILFPIGRLSQLIPRLSCLDDSVVDTGHGAMAVPSFSLSSPAPTAAISIPTQPPSAASKNHTVPIVAGILGGLSVIMLFGLGLLWRMRRKAKIVAVPAQSEGRLMDEEARVSEVMQKAPSS
jgi:hypothetical protein